MMARHQVAEPVFTVLDIPERLEAWRDWKGMSCKRLSELSGVHRAVMWKWWDGRGYPQLNSVAKVIDALDVTIHELLGETPGELEHRLSLQVVRVGSKK